MNKMSSVPVSNLPVKQTSLVSLPSLANVLTVVVSPLSFITQIVAVIGISYLLSMLNNYVMKKFSYNPNFKNKRKIEDYIDTLSEARFYKWLAVIVSLAIVFIASYFVGGILLHTVFKNVNIAEVLTNRSLVNIAPYIIGVCIIFIVSLIDVFNGIYAHSNINIPKVNFPGETLFNKLYSNIKMK